MNKDKKTKNDKKKPMNQQMSGKKGKAKSDYQKENEHPEKPSIIEAFIHKPPVKH